MPAGYETPVGEGGGALSGGQKQRLAIARALIGSPKLIVLDEPTSAVDGRTEKLIRQTLSELRGHVTVVIISHRIETTAQCDLLLVLANGKIADYGERDAVLAGSAYRDIVLNRHELDGDHTSEDSAREEHGASRIPPVALGALTSGRSFLASPTSTWCCPTTPPDSTTERTTSPRKLRPHRKPPSAGTTSTPPSGLPKSERSEQRQ